MHLFIDLEIAQNSQGLGADFTISPYHLTQLRICEQSLGIVDETLGFVNKPTSSTNLVGYNESKNRVFSSSISIVCFDIV